MTEEQIPYFEDKKEPMIDGKPIVERNVVHVLVINRKTDEVLCLDWQSFGWHGLIVGGIEDGEDPVEAAQREVKEETGYSDIKFITELGKTTSAFYAAHKEQNRIAHATGLLFELVSDARSEVSAEETKNHVCKWIPKNEVKDFMNLDNQLYLWAKAEKFLSENQ